jgi:hypothetical protein
MVSEHVAGSFRDPSGFVYIRQGQVYRQINECYREDYDLLMGSGLYEYLSSTGMLVSHVEVEGAESPRPEGMYKTIKPEMVPFISYPYEWSFSQLKDAALQTLDVQRAALEYGMTLKDSSAYNIQFLRGKPVFIDTLSFERYEEGSPWTPYQQFCRHFLGTLALMSLVDVRLRRLARTFVDGIPLDLVSTLLPYRSRLNFALFLHVHLHARSQKRYSDKPLGKTKFTHKVSRLALMGLLDSLESTVRKLKWAASGTEWAEYYSDDSYTTAGLEHKKQIVSAYLRKAQPKMVWDLGANTGLHSRLASALGANVVSFDMDPACVERNYLEVVRTKEENVLPLVLDLTNPSPSIGWENEERHSIRERAGADTAMALALIHHLAISNNLPLGRLAQFFGRLCNWLIIEFVPKSDHKVQRLLATREDVFPDYTQECFEREFAMVFEIVESQQVAESGRVLYLMSRKLS